MAAYVLSDSEITIERKCHVTLGFIHYMEIIIPSDAAAIRDTMEKVEAQNAKIFEYKKSNNPVEHNMMVLQAREDKLRMLEDIRDILQFEIANNGLPNANANANYLTRAASYNQEMAMIV